MLAIYYYQLEILPNHNYDATSLYYIVFQLHTTKPPCRQKSASRFALLL